MAVTNMRIKTSVHVGSTVAVAAALCVSVLATAVTGGLLAVFATQRPAPVTAAVFGLAVTVQPSPAPASPPPPSTEALFTYPRLFDQSGRLLATPEEDTAIERKILELLGQAAPGATVRLAMYHLSRPEFAPALCGLAGRGVTDVQVILDQSNLPSEDEADPGTSLYAQLRACLGSKLVVCENGATGSGNGGCNGTGINHNKLLLISDTTNGSRHLVAISSSNLTTQQRYNFNNLFIIRDIDPKLFYGLWHYTDALAEQSSIWSYRRLYGQTSRTVGADGTDAVHKVYLFPKPGGGDTVEEILENVDCRKTGPNGQPATVHVAMALWSDGRKNLAEQLRTMGAAGCQVKVIVRSDPGGEGSSATPGSEVRSLLRTTAGVEWLPFKLVCIQRDGAGKCTRSVGLHSKYFLVQGHYAGAWRQAVFAGSHNFTLGALRYNDEILLRVLDPSAHAWYLADWQRLRDLANRLNAL